MSQFDRALFFYGQEGKRILASPRNEWAIDPYAWSDLIEMTPIELAIWARIREANAVFYPQYPVGRFFADFANPVAKVAIECDGAKYHHDKEKDAARDAFFNSIGWVVYRIPGNVCVTEYDEEIDLPAYAYRIVKGIAEKHGLTRGKSGSATGLSAAIPLVNFLLEQNA